MLKNSGVTGLPVSELLTENQQGEEQNYPLNLDQTARCK